MRAVTHRGLDRRTYPLPKAAPPGDDRTGAPGRADRRSTIVLSGACPRGEQEPHWQALPSLTHKDLHRHPHRRDRWRDPRAPFSHRRPVGKREPWNPGSSAGLRGTSPPGPRKHAASPALATPPVAVADPCTRTAAPRPRGRRRNPRSRADPPGRAPVRLVRKTGRDRHPLPIARVMPARHAHRHFATVFHNGVGEGCLFIGPRVRPGNPRHRPPRAASRKI